MEFGRIAPTEPQKEQVNGDGWAWRYKVRIFSKHPEDKSILADEDLPWAQVLLPVTAGSGAANQAIFPMINQGDTVAISYLDEAEQQPVIIGVLPRTQGVSVGPANDNGYTPTSGFTSDKPQTGKVAADEANESNRNTQPTPPGRDVAAAVGNKVTLADNCDPNAYKINAITTEIDNLFNQIRKFSQDVAYVESLIVGSVDRIHSLVNPYVGEMLNNLFESLIPVLNAGLKALYQKVYSIVLASTQNPVAARLAAEAALIALIPAIQALQEAIQFVAAEIVNNLLSKVDDLVRDAVDNNENFSSCAGEQFSGAIVNAIIGEIDKGIQPLLNAVSVILSGGFAIANVIRGSIDIVRSFAGGLLGASQGANKCKGSIKEYAIGIGPVDDIGDILNNIMNVANQGAALVEDAQNAVGDITSGINQIQEVFGDFPFLSGESLGISVLSDCSTEPPSVCGEPEVIIFGGRGEGARAKAIIGDYVQSTDPRTITDVQGGVVAIEVLDGGSGYEYPPFVEIRDNCGLGIGAVARSVINSNGEVTRIYIVTPGEGYPSDGRSLFTVGSVEILDGGSNYTAGIVNDQFGGEFEVVITPGAPQGSVTAVIPRNIVQVPTIPVIEVPNISPPIPPGGNLITREVEGVNVQFVVDSRGREIGRAVIGSGLRIKPILIPLPNADAILAGEIPIELQDRISQEEVQQIIDCVLS